MADVRSRETRTPRPIAPQISRRATAVGDPVDRFVPAAALDAPREPGLARSLRGAASTATAPRRIAFNPLLYATHELQRGGAKTALAAMSAGLSVQMAMVNVASMWGFAPKPYADFARDVISATREMSDRFAKEYTRPAFGLDTTVVGGRVVDGRQVGGKTVGVKEEIVSDRTFGSLLHFKRDTDRNDPKLLIVAPMSGHYATLLRDTVKEMLPNHDVYITDWKDARQVPASEGEFGLDDYIDYVKDFIHDIGPQTHVMAVCQPTVATLAAVSRLAQEKSAVQPLSMTLMGGPLDTAAAPTQVTKFAAGKSLDWFENNVIGQVPANYPGGGRLVYPGFVQLFSFMAMNPEKHTRSHVDMFNHLVQGRTDKADKLKAFYDEYLAVCDLPAPFYLETVKKVFIDRDLARGTLTHRGAPVDPSAIHGTALFTVEGEKDDICAPGQTTAAHVLCKGIDAAERFHHLEKGAGHYGIFNGHGWREDIAPRVTGFIREAAARRGIQYDAPTQAVPPQRRDTLAR